MGFWRPHAAPLAGCSQYRNCLVELPNNFRCRFLSTVSNESQVQKRQTALKAGPRPCVRDNYSFTALWQTQLIPGKQHFLHAARTLPCIDKSHASFYMHRRASDPRLPAACCINASSQLKRASCGSAKVPGKALSRPLCGHC